MSMAREYHSMVKTRFGPGGPSCRCCQPHHTRVSARRAVRRKARQHTLMFVRRPTPRNIEPIDDYELDYGWEDDWLNGEPLIVTWRMLNDPFRLVPSWLRDDAVDDYERERAVWALTSERLCWVWGVPVSWCSAIHRFVYRLVYLHSEKPWSVPMTTCHHGGYA